MQVFVAFTSELVLEPNRFVHALDRLTNSPPKGRNLNSGNNKTYSPCWNIPTFWSSAGIGLHMHSVDCNSFIASLSSVAPTNERTISTPNSQFYFTRRSWSFRMWILKSQSIGQNTQSLPEYWLIAIPSSSLPKFSGPDRGGSSDIRPELWPFRSQSSHKSPFESPGG